mgnify:CR=1 FL=1
MFNKLIIFSFLIFLGSSNLNAAVTVVGSSDALICYKHAKYGYTTQSSVFTCLKAISDKTIVFPFVNYTDYKLVLVMTFGRLFQTD